MNQSFVPHKLLSVYICLLLSRSIFTVCVLIMFTTITTEVNYLFKYLMLIFLSGVLMLFATAFISFILSMCIYVCVCVRCVCMCACVCDVCVRVYACVYRCASSLCESIFVLLLFCVTLLYS